MIKFSLINVFALQTILFTLIYCEYSRKADCDFHVTIIRQLENDGFHREIHSLVELVGGHGIIQRQHCTLAIKEIMPSGLYVNPDQLEDLARLGQVQACAASSVDIEAPEPLSSNFTVFIYSGFERAENLLSAEVMLPVHARYHAPSSDGGYRSITVKSPELFLRCAGRFNCPEIINDVFPCYACSEELCTWSKLPFKTNAESLKMLVPVGNMQHYYLVTCLTYIITIGGAIYILSVLANSAENIL